MRFLVVLGLVTCVSFAHPARADGPAPAPPFDVKELAARPGAQRYELSLTNGPIRAGGAAIVIAADPASVRRLVTDYAKYETWLPGFRRSRVLARTPDQTDVYLEVPILHGAAKLWAVTRFVPPQAEDGGERIEGKMIGPGNVDDLRAVWHIAPVDEKHTLLRLELLLVPKLHFGSGILTAALAESADDAISACRRRLEAP
jgi:ribosome-associated toxin RatA of RatAB toxin-antitoxin module